MSTEIVTQLVHEKDQLLNELQKFQAALAVAVLEHGNTKSNVAELRVSQAQLNKLNHRVNIRPLNKGGLVVEVAEVEA